MSEVRLQDAIRVVQFRCQQRLRHLGDVRVMPHDHDLEVGVALFLHSRAGRWRHAVVGASSDATADPVGFADIAANKLVEWAAANMPCAPDRTSDWGKAKWDAE
jgi:hypothetical protein